MACRKCSEKKTSDPIFYIGIPDKQTKVAFVTLGCAKNQVDSEVMLGILRKSGVKVVSEVSDAHVVVINTCGFLQSAVKEALDCILEVAQYKRTGNLKRLIVAGCLVERYGEALKDQLPEVDAFVKVDDIPRILLPVAGVSLIEEDSNKEGKGPSFLYNHRFPRELGKKPHSAWLKVADGCNHQCAFCLIPSIRGRMRSRSFKSVIEEAEVLGKKGVKEINLVAQDLTAWGDDVRSTGEKRRLVDLVKAIDKKKAVQWLRLLYAYPTGISDELIRAIVELPSVCEYLDIPLQHSSEAVLKNMRRPLGRFLPRRLVERIKTLAPSISLRTTFIVGFPGETEKDLEELREFVAEGHFSSVGVFAYSAEEGTPAYSMKGAMNEREKQARLRRIMSTQKKVVARILRGYLGKELEVLVEGTHSDSDLLWSGRTRFQAPEVDGQVIINDVAEGVKGLKAGSIARVEITGVAGYDLVGTVVSTLRV